MRASPTTTLVCAAGLALIGLGYACGKDASGPGAGRPGIAFLAGAAVSDTIGATLPQAVRIEVRGPGGGTAAHVAVVVEGVILPASNGATYTEVLVRRMGTSQFGGAAADSTDTSGLVSFQVKLGSRAGPGRLVVTVPAFGLRDTARFTIQPGGATVLLLSPSDTALQVGRSATLDAATYDALGNRRSDPISFAGQGDAVSLDGATMTAGKFGQATVSARAGGLSASAHVGVVPAGTIAASRSPQSTAYEFALYTLGLDGSGLRQLRPSVAVGYAGDMPMGWLTDSLLVYQDNNYSHTKQLYVHDLATGASRRFLPPADQMEQDSLPRVSLDRRWVYFSGGTPGSYVVYRARPDGTGKERISLPGVSVVQWGATQSPDGSKLVYVSRGDYFAGELEMMSLATRQVQKLNIYGVFPRWSPDGRSIAYLAQPEDWPYSPAPLMLMNADGSGVRPLGPANLSFSGDIDWSPDSKYIVGSAGGKLTVVEVAGGQAVQVPIAGLNGTLTAPCWKP